MDAMGSTAATSLYRRQILHDNVAGASCDLVLGLQRLNSERRIAGAQDAILAEIHISFFFSVSLTSISVRMPKPSFFSSSVTRTMAASKEYSGFWRNSRTLAVSPNLAQFLSKIVYRELACRKCRACAKRNFSVQWHLAANIIQRIDS